MQMLNSIANNRFWNKNARTIIWAAAALCLLFALSRVAWVTYSQAKERQANYELPQLAPLAQPVKKIYRVNDITTANLFGDPTPKPVVTKAPKTTLNLTLQGILSASDPAMARAIISSGKQKTKLYSVGESIQGAGASIKEIKPFEVLLNRAGATESLPLIKATKSGKNPIISFTNYNDSSGNQVAATNPTSADSRLEQFQEFSAANRASNQRSRATNGQPRKVRKPNFSGLDRALKKMGEL